VASRLDAFADSPMTLGSLAFHFLAQLALGSLFLLAWVPPPREGRGFGTFMAATSLVLLGLGVMAGGTPIVRGDEGGDSARWCLLSIAALLAVVTGATFGGLHELARWTLVPLAIAGGGFLVLAARVGLAAPGARPATASLAGDGGFLGAAAILDGANYFVSSLLLGAVWLSMLLGHWYLVSPAMPLDPLRRLTRGFLGLVGAKAVLLVATFAALAVGAPPAAPGALPLGLGAFEWMLVFGRVLVGVGGAGVLAWMTLKTLELRSTTSATGLLYVAIAVVWMGEFFARMFAQTVGVNL
jgi:hypothetical protein